MSRLPQYARCVSDPVASLQPRCTLTPPHRATNATMIRPSLAMDLDLFGAMAAQQVADAVVAVAGLARDPDADPVLGEARIVGRGSLDLRQPAERQHAEQVGQGAEQNHALVADHDERR